MTVEHEIVDGICKMHECPGKLCFEMMEIKAELNGLRSLLKRLDEVEESERAGVDPTVVRLGRFLGSVPKAGSGHVLRRGGLVMVVLIKAEKAPCDECGKGIHAECPKYQWMADVSGWPSGCCCFTDHFEKRELG